MPKLGIEDLDLKGKKVLVRVDFNVPIDDNLNITDDIRIRESLPTIKYILSNGGKAILVSHLGRPDGKVVEKLRMAPVAKRLEELLGKKIFYVKGCIGEEVKKTISLMKDGDCVLLENVRFYKEEEENDLNFAKSLAQLADIYVNDAFGTAHRAHASTVGVTKYVPKSVAGYLMLKEIKYLGDVLANPKRPFLAILGGAKISSKIDLIKNLLEKVDMLIIGPAMAYTFFLARGIEVGKSLVEKDKVLVAKEIFKRAIDKNVPLMLPIDHIVAKSKSEDSESKLVTRVGIPSDWEAVDIGPKTVEKYSHAIKKAKTILWNGPLGVFEIKKFSEGTFAIAKLVAESDAVTIVGGGDSASAIQQSGYADKIAHISTGGGASLEFMEGKELPGISALTNK
ncbi:MAG: phosphoglycerate kinase [Candidatus Firestonebacteria bacterium]